MTTFVLIHGAWQSGGCWSLVSDALLAKACRAISPDLLGMGDYDGAAAANVTLAAWADQIADIVRREREPVVLVGHSRGGIVINEVAERVPSLIRHLVYLAAPLVGDGQSLNSVSAQDPSEAPPDVLMIDPSGMGRITREAALQMFFNTIPAHLVEKALGGLRPEPMAVFSTALSLSTARFGTVPRAYIECARDNAVSLSEQRRMQLAMPCDPVFTLDTDHSPFYSDAAGLVRCLSAIAAAS